MKAFKIIWLSLITFCCLLSTTLLSVQCLNNSFYYNLKIGERLYISSTTYACDTNYMISLKQNNCAIKVYTNNELDHVYSANTEYIIYDWI